LKGIERKETNYSDIRIIQIYKGKKGEIIKEFEKEIIKKYNEIIEKKREMWRK